MPPIQFTDREMQKAWRINLQASTQSCCDTPHSNAHRLLLFYSVECGLKAVLMKRQSKTSTSHCREIEDAQHNINKLLDHLSAGQNLKLPSQLQMNPIKCQKQSTERKLDVGKINQVWRYGGCLENDKEIENKLMRISDWIKQELGA